MVVFALPEDGVESGPKPTLLLQLAISIDGITARSLQNTAIGNASEVEGTVDRESQRAAGLWAPLVDP